MSCVEKIQMEEVSSLSRAVWKWSQNIQDVSTAFWHMWRHLEPKYEEIIWLIKSKWNV